MEFEGLGMSLRFDSEGVSAFKAFGSLESKQIGVLNIFSMTLDEKQQMLVDINYSWYIKVFLREFRIGNLLKYI